MVEGWQAQIFARQLAGASGSCGRELAGIETASLDSRVWASRTLVTSSEEARIHRFDHWRFSPLVLKWAFRIFCKGSEMPEHRYIKPLEALADCSRRFP